MGLNQFELYNLFNGETVNAIAFGSKDKQTAEGKFRIVDVDGNIYSLQKEVYYPTGQNVLEPQASLQLND
jgi:hypothetical protein